MKLLKWGLSLLGLWYYIKEIRRITEDLKIRKEMLWFSVQSYREHADYIRSQPCYYAKWNESDRQLVKEMLDCADSAKRQLDELTFTKYWRDKDETS